MSEPRSPLLKTKIDPLGLLAAAGSIACIATIGGFLGRFGWVLDELSHFRLQYALALLILAGVFAWRRRRKASLVFTGFAAVNFVLLAHYYFTGAAAGPPGDPTIRVVLINVHTENRGYDRVAAFIRRIKPDVLVLEEVDEVWMKHLAKLQEDLPHFCAEPQSDNFGIALFSRLPLTHASIEYFGSAEVPSVIAEVRVEGSRVRIVGTHPLPPGGADQARLRNEQLSAVAGFVSGE